MNPAPTKPVEMPCFAVPVLRLRQPDGSVLVKAGRPQVVPLEVSVKDFCKATGLSIRHCATLCESGLIQHRRLSPKPRSKILIPRSEIARFHALGKVTPMPSKVPKDGFGDGETPKTVSGASYPSARLGSKPLNQ